MDRIVRQYRTVDTKFNTRADGEELRIEGYFAVFNSPTELFPGATESVAPGAFAETISGDVRCLIDHETRLVLGRTAAGTFTLREDSHGLWGSVVINPKDSDAMNLYERVKRGDVNQCSFGFEIIEEDTEYRDDGTVHWTIRKVKLYEGSVVTFPAYEDTGVAVRKKQLETIRARQVKIWKNSAMRKLKGDNANA